MKLSKLILFSSMLIFFSCKPRGLESTAFANTNPQNLLMTIAEDLKESDHPADMNGRAAIKRLYDRFTHNANSRPTQLIELNLVSNCKQSWASDFLNIKQLVVPGNYGVDRVGVVLVFNSKEALKNFAHFSYHFSASVKFTDAKEKEIEIPICGSYREK